MRISSPSPSPSEAFADETVVEVADEMALKTSPDAIDARRAHQLLERAATLAARGDMGAAILATRQSLALSPATVEGHLLLARLLERNRDFGGARAAYEKIVQLAPDRADARENLARIAAYLQQSQNAARQFHFDEDELFAPAAENAPAAVAAVVGEVGANAHPENLAPVAATPVAATPTDSAPSIEARLPPSRAENPSETGVAPIEMPRDATQNFGPANERRKNNVPVATERRRRPAAVVPVSLAPNAAAPAPLRPAVAAPLATPLTARALDNVFNLDAGINSGVTPRLPLDLDLPAAAPAPLWQQVMARPSFYARTLPVVGVALLGLGFLSWARGRAVSQFVASAPTQLSQTSSPASDATAQSATQTGIAAPNNATNSNAAATGNNSGGFPISNAPFSFPAPASGNAANAATAPATANSQTRNAAPARANGRANGNSTPRFPRRVSSPSRRVPGFPSVSLAPAPIPPASVRSTAARAIQSEGGNNIVLPRPSVDLPTAPVQNQRALPPGDGGLNPAGASGRGYVRVTESRVGNGVIPSQPSGLARQNESSANDAARNGQIDQAISQLSQAIRADSDNAGFRYQQRATLFLQRGDYNRASDDFQSAISAYQNQINSGNDVAAARRGLNSARSGLNLALAGKRG